MLALLGALDGLQAPGAVALAEGPVLVHDRLLVALGVVGAHEPPALGLDVVEQRRLHEHHDAVVLVVGAVHQADLVDLEHLHVDDVALAARREVVEPAVPLGHEIGGHQLAQARSVVAGPRVLHGEVQLTGARRDLGRVERRVVLGRLGSRGLDGAEPLARRLGVGHVALARLAQRRKDHEEDDDRDDDEQPGAAAPTGAAGESAAASASGEAATAATAGEATAPSAAAEAAAAAAGGRLSGRRQRQDQQGR